MADLLYGLDPLGKWEIPKMTLEAGAVGCIPTTGRAPIAELEAAPGST